MTIVDDMQHSFSVEDGVNLFDDYLEHHGILGQKWGVKNGPPYPLGSGDHNASERAAGWQQSLSAAGKKLRGFSEKAGEKIKKTAQNTSAEIHRRNEVRTTAKREKEETDRRAEQERRETERSNAIKSGDTQYAEDNFTNMSEAEINELLRRVDLKQKVDKAAGVKGEQTFSDKVDNAMYKVNQIRNWYITGANTWNDFAKLYNSFSDEKLPIIGADNAEAKRQLEKKRKEKQMQDYYDAVVRDPKTKDNPEYLQDLDDEHLKLAAARRRNMDTATGIEKNPSAEEVVNYLKKNGVDIDKNTADDAISNFSRRNNSQQQNQKPNKNKSSDQQKNDEYSNNISNLAAEEEGKRQRREERDKQYQEELRNRPTAPTAEQEYSRRLSEYANEIDEQNRRRAQEEGYNYLEGQYYQKHNNSNNTQDSNQKYLPAYSPWEDEDEWERQYSYSTRHSGIDSFNDYLTVLEG